MPALQRLSTGDSLIWADDWAYMVKNQNRTSEGPVYIKAIKTDMNTNIIARLEASSSTGDEVTYAVSMSEVDNLRGYALTLSINPRDWELVGYEDCLANYHPVLNMRKSLGFDELFISATQGFNPIYSKEVELFTFTVRNLTSDPEAISIAGAEIVGLDGKMVKAVIETPADALPEEFSLDQNFPNPFNPTTTINFALPEPGDVKLLVFNLLGQEVRTLTSGVMEPGAYKVVWNSLDNTGQKVSTGLYFYRLVVDNKVIQTRKMLLLK